MASLLSRVRKYIIIIMALLLMYTFIEPYWLKTKTYTIAGPDPPSFQRQRLFCRIFTMGPFFRKETQKACRKVNRLGLILSCLAAITSTGLEI